MSSVFSRKMTMSTFSGCFTGEGTPVKYCTGPQANVEIEHLPQRDIERADAAADRRGQRAFDADEKFLERLDRVVRQPVVEFVLRRLAGEDLDPRDLLRAAVRLLHRRIEHTRSLAAQMSGPVPSPRMNGMIGRSGTLSLPAAMVIFSPAGTVQVV